MESIFLKLIDSSPVLAVVFILWYVQRKDYVSLVTTTQDENLKREINYQETIKENQAIICNLTNKLNVVEDVKEDVEDIKDYLFKK
jgi:DNA-binding transcriptional regulator GbsR (MarR family)